MAADYTAIYGIDRDIETGAVISGLDVVPQQVYKRLFGYMFWDDKSLNISEFLMDKIDLARQKYIEATISKIFDEEIRFSVEPTVEYVDRKLVVKIVITPTTNDAPIVMTYIKETNELKIERQT